MLFSDESNFQVCKMGSTTVQCPRSSDRFDPRYIVPTVNDCNWMPASHYNDQPSHSCHIQPTKLHHLGATLFLANCSILDFEHLLHNHLVRPLYEWQEIKIQVLICTCCTETIR